MQPVSGKPTLRPSTASASASDDPGGAAGPSGQAGADGISGPHDRAANRARRLQALRLPPRATSAHARETAATLKSQSNTFQAVAVGSTALFVAAATRQLFFEPFDPLDSKWGVVLAAMVGGGAALFKADRLEKRAHRLLDTEDRFDQVRAVQDAAIADTARAKVD